MLRASVAQKPTMAVSDGTVVWLGAEQPGRALHPDAEIIDLAGAFVAPAFVDPHVHLRAPGQEHKEDIATGTAAAAAGGYIGIVAMPNTFPPIDSAPVLKSVRETAERDAIVEVGFLPCITVGMEGRQLTEMAELRDEGYRMALVTNNVREWESHWRALAPVDDIFELVVDSAFVGMRKPDPEIYELTLERLGDGITGEECVFVDDVDVNCDMARELGMRAVHYVSAEQAIADVEAALAAD